MDRDTEAVLDEYLVLLAQGGSADAFRRLVERWTPRLRRHAGRVLLDADAATDAVQDAWLAIARGLRRLDDPARFGGWALAIASRRCVDEIRRRQRRRGLARSVALAPADPPPDDPDRTLDLSAALMRLPPDQRLLVSLFYGEGLSVEEIALAHHVPPGTIKSRLHAIRQTLRTHLEGADNDPD
ncbi:MAG TPA: sigma-70 family RNA polymerase sigma factor [Caulobacter sp.]|nr:sigma-70 family RNA polymerase sigma factor [Caulobacter sp.]